MRYLKKIKISVGLPNLLCFILDSRAIIKKNCFFFYLCPILVSFSPKQLWAIRSPNWNPWNFWVFSLFVNMLSYSLSSLPPMSKLNQDNMQKCYLLTIYTSPKENYLQEKTHLRLRVRVVKNRPAIAGAHQDMLP